MWSPEPWLSFLWFDFFKFVSLQFSYCTECRGDQSCGNVVQYAVNFYRWLDGKCSYNWSILWLFIISLSSFHTTVLIQLQEIFQCQVWRVFRMKIAMFLAFFFFLKNCRHCGNTNILFVTVWIETTLVERGFQLPQAYKVWNVAAAKLLQWVFLALWKEVCIKALKLRTSFESRLCLIGKI